MALQGEGDPRWVVREREDGRNVNGWHWEDKDVTNWAKDRIRELLTGPLCSASDGSISVSVDKVDSVEGDATLYNRKGVLKVLYDLKVAGKWMTSHTEKDDRTNGEFKFELFDEEPEITVTIDSKSKAEFKYKTLFVNKVCPVMVDQCCIFIKEMHAGAGQSLDGLAMPTKEKSVETKVTDYKRSGMNQPTKPKKAAANTSTLVMKDIFNCSSGDMFLALIDRPRLEAITRAKALSEAKEGGRFNLLNGTARGSYIKLVPGAEIGMKWKLKTWDDDAPEGDATIIIKEEDQGKTELEVRIEGVPNSEKTGTEGFWRVQIFQAMKIVMGWGSASQFL